jgi:Skp family chaperone for outer membrane proteins
MTRKLKTLLAAAAVLAVAVAALVSVPAGAQTRPDSVVVAKTPTGIRTVDLVKAFNNLTQKTDGETDIRNLKDKLDKDGKTLNDELEALKKELDLYKSESPEYRVTEEKLLRKVSDVAAFGEYVERRLLLEQRLKTLQTYSALRKGVEDYARENGIALVLMTDEPNLLEARSQEALLQRISMRKVIYAHESMDITSKVVERLNADYQRQKNNAVTKPN